MLAKVEGIEPPYTVLETDALPLCYTLKLRAPPKQRPKFLTLLLNKNRRRKVRVGLLYNNDRSHEPYNEYCHFSSSFGFQ